MIAVLGVYAGIFTSQAPAIAATAPQPVKSISIHGSMTAAGAWSYNYSPYERYSSPIGSYLTLNDDGTFTRVEANESKAAIYIETYSSSDFQIQSTKTLDMRAPWEDYDRETLKKPLFGGIYFGEEYNYVFLGQKNETEDDTKDVIRFVRYTPDWEIVDAYNLCHINTFEPFAAGSLRCTEYGDMLYVHTCHEMYKSSDGYNHQANLRFCFNQETGEISDQHYVVSNEKEGYSSHSFNQFIETTGKDVYTLDHGDAYPRGILLSKYAGKAGTELGRPTATQTVLTFPGSIGDNSTKAAVGGLAVTPTKCLILYNQASSGSQRSVYLGSIAKDEIGSGSMQITTLDTPEDGGTCGVPMLTELPDDRYLVRWQIYSKEGSIIKQSHYTILDSEGNVQSCPEAIDAFLSDCQPAVSDDGVVTWYTTGNSSGSATVPTFFQLNTETGEFTSKQAYSLTILKAPVLKTVNKKKGVLSGTGPKNSTIHIQFAGREFIVNCNKKKNFKLTLRKAYKKKLKSGSKITVWATKDGYGDSKKVTYKVN